MALVGARLFLFGNVDSDSGLWVSDGTAVGTRHISLVRLEHNPFDGDVLPAVLGNALFFPGLQDTTDDILWTSDGTEAGTRPVLDREGHTIFFPRSLRIFAGRLVFTSGNTLWQSDGTPQGTFQIRDLGTLYTPDGWKLVAAGNRLFFAAYDRDTGTELWALDGP